MPKHQPKHMRLIKKSPGATVEIGGQDWPVGKGSISPNQSGVSTRDDRKLGVVGGHSRRERSKPVGEIEK